MEYATRNPDTRSTDKFLIDLPQFARDFAKFTGGKVVTKSETVHDANRWQKVQLSEHVIVRFGTDTSKGRLEVDLDYVPGIAHYDRNIYDKSHKTESCTVDPNRAMANVSQDITRRVVLPSMPAIQKQIEYAHQQRKARAGIAATIAAFKKANPRLEVRQQKPETDQGATFHTPYHVKARTYHEKQGEVDISGDLDHNGRIDIDKICGLDLEGFLEIKATLARIRKRQRSKQAA